MAADQNIKDALTFGNTNAWGISAKTINDAALNRIKAWFTATYSTELAGRTVSADDLAAYMWTVVSEQTKMYEKGVAQAALDAPAEIG